MGNYCNKCIYTIPIIFKTQDMLATEVLGRKRMAVTTPASLN